MILAACGLVLSMQAAAPPPALADVAKKIEEQRAKRTADQRTEPADTRADPAAAGDRTSADADKETATDATTKTSFTNSDLKKEPVAAAIVPDGTLQPTWRAPSSAATAGDVAQGTLGRMRSEARQRYWSALNGMRSRISGYYALSEAYFVRCQRDSFKDLAPYELQSHKTACRQQQSALNAQKKVVDAFVEWLQADAAKYGIYPGVIRDLLTDVGWRP